MAAAEIGYEGLGSVAPAPLLGGVEAGQATRAPGGRYDVTLFAAAVTLLVVGTLLVFSTTARPVMGGSATADPFYHLKHHGLMFAVGVAFYLLAIHVPARFITAAARALLPVSIVLLLGVAFFGDSRLGAKRWFNLGGITIQPSEIAKVGFALYLARYLETRRTVLNDVLTGIVPLAFMYVVVALLLAIQPDVGSVVLLGALVVAMLIVGGTRLTFLGPLFGVLVVGIVGIILVQPEKLARFVGYFYPEATRMGEGYQIFNSQILVGSGGLWGEGLGEGVHHALGYLPQSANDFIFSVASEELGFIGVCSLVLLYVAIGLRGFAIARMCRDDFQRFAAFALTLLLTLPAVVHMAVGLGMMPTKGLVCVFLSYGGSAMVASLGTLGLLQRFHLDATAAADAGLATARKDA